MSSIVPALAGAGLALIVAGMPLFRRARLSERVEPFLAGLHGRPSGLHRARGGTPPALLARISSLLPARDDLDRRLAAAGDARTAAEFRVEQTVWALGGVATAIAVVLVAAAARAGVDAVAVPPFVMLGGVTGWAARDWMLGRRTERRRAALAEELPSAIDLLVLALMAGESVPAACARVSSLLCGPLAQEIDAVLGDVRSGLPVTEAFESFALRVDEPAVDRFVDALCTGIEKGAPLADVLRAQADDGREKRRRHLMEMGGRREVWMLVPVVFLIMPVVVVWALFPGLVSLDLLVP